MSKYSKILIGLVIIGCFAILYKCCLADTCPRVDDCYRGMKARSFSKEAWDIPTKENLEKGGTGKEPSDIICERESMICDLTQNVIPIGTTYEKVISLLGSGGKSMPIKLEDDRYSYLYDDDKCTAALNEKKLLIYASGGNVSGKNGLIIIFENGRIKEFLRTEAM